MSGLRRLNGQVSFALVLLVMTTVYASQIPQLGIPFTRSGEPGPSLLPIVLSVILFIGAIRIILAEFRGARPTSSRPAANSGHVPAISLVGPVLLILLTGLFAAGLLHVGYFVSAGLYCFAVALYFNFEETGRPLRAIGLSAVTAAAITVFGWLFFDKLFGLSLPGWSL